ncbi:hypothetical protein CTAYLR_009515 [Chrysophaeum taylorii]|uniref:Phytanoyl-CoA dioxygenase n=1 Tax=Chrysophaeum taylorii TaxID=2483200 RepID=A0AAD7ULK1_9STRA|nr:hypothetical protein CTAYLR_009515 [Chrysophaeum taylorii]
MIIILLLLLLPCASGAFTESLSTASRRELLGSSGGIVSGAAIAALLSQNKDTPRLATSSVAATASLRAQARAAGEAAAACAGTYARDGVTVVRGVVAPFWIELLREGCEEAQDEASDLAQFIGAPTDASTFFTDLELARRLPSFAAFALHGPCAAVASGITGSKSVRYLYDQLFLKPEGVSVPTPWHQDGGYWCAAGQDLCSVFVPLDVVKARECLAFLPGTHRWPLHNPSHFADGTPYMGTTLPPLPDIDAIIDDKNPPLQFDLQPGDVLVFSSRTVHGGRGNWGRALSTRWAGDDVRFWPRPGEGAVPTGNLHLNNGDPLAKNPDAFPLAWSTNDKLSSFL